MKAKKRTKKRKMEHTGSTFESFLEEEQIREEVDAAAANRVLSWQLSEVLRKTKLPDSSCKSK